MPAMPPAPLVISSIDVLNVPCALRVTLVLCDSDGNRLIGETTTGEIVRGGGGVTDPVTGDLTLNVIPNAEVTNYANTYYKVTLDFGQKFAPFLIEKTGASQRLLAARVFVVDTTTAAYGFSNLVDGPIDVPADGEAITWSTALGRAEWAPGGGAAMTGAQILAALVPVDGTGSGLDADTLDGTHLVDLATAQELTDAEGTLSGQMSTHAAAVDPHGDRAFATSADSTHAALTSGVHGITAAAATVLDDTTVGAMRTTLGVGSVVGGQDVGSVIGHAAMGAAATSLLTSTITLPATFTTGDLIDIYAAGTISNTSGGGRNYTFRLVIGSTTVITVAINSVTSGTSPNFMFTAQGRFSAVAAQSWVGSVVGSTAGTVSHAVGTSTENFASTKALDLTIQSNSSGATQSATLSFIAVRRTPA